MLRIRIFSNNWRLSDIEKFHGISFDFWYGKNLNFLIHNVIFFVEVKMCFFWLKKESRIMNSSSDSSKFAQASKSLLWALYIDYFIMVLNFDLYPFLFSFCRFQPFFPNEHVQRDQNLFNRFRFTLRREGKNWYRRKSAVHEWSPYWRPDILKVFAFSPYN